MRGIASTIGFSPRPFLFFFLVALSLSCCAQDIPTHWATFRVINNLFPLPSFVVECPATQNLLQAFLVIVKRPLLNSVSKLS